MLIYGNVTVTLVFCLRGVQNTFENDYSFKSSFIYNILRKRKQLMIVSKGDLNISYFANTSEVRIFSCLRHVGSTNMQTRFKYGQIKGRNVGKSTVKEKRKHVRIFRVSSPSFLLPFPWPTTKDPSDKNR